MLPHPAGECLGGGVEDRFGGHGRAGDRIDAFDALLANDLGRRLRQGGIELLLLVAGDAEPLDPVYLVVDVVEEGATEESLAAMGKQELYALATKLNVEGRSSMSKGELVEAILEAQED